VANMKGTSVPKGSKGPESNLLKKKVGGEWKKNVTKRGRVMEGNSSLSS